MSHPVNDEILERLYEEVFEERSISPECNDPVILFDINKEVKAERSIPADCNDNTIMFDVIKEAMKRFQELSQ